MGFRAPPPDGSDPDGGGGNDLYDIYVQKLGTGVYGYCQPTYYYGGGGYPANAATSYVRHRQQLLRLRLSRPSGPDEGHGRPRVLPRSPGAHDVNEPTWYKESTSVWAEEHGLRQYRRLHAVPLELPEFDVTGRSTTTTVTSAWYGSCVWNFFLSEYFEPDIVPDKWWQMEGSGQTLDMMDVVLGTYGSSMEEAYEEFATWVWFTGGRTDGSHFEESSIWPAAAIMRGHNSYPIAIGGPTPGWEPDSYGCNYVQFNNPAGGDDGLLIEYRRSVSPHVPRTLCVSTTVARVGPTTSTVGWS